jgi:hypothetical protein
VGIYKGFCDTRLEPWAKATFEHTCKNNWFWFRAGIRRLRACESLAKATLDEITNEKVAGFAVHEQARWQNRVEVRKKTNAGWRSALSTVRSVCSVVF